MLLGVVSAILIAGAGFAALRVLGIDCGAVNFGLAPATGVGLLAVLATWGVRLGLPAAAEGLGLLAVSLTGLVFAGRELHVRGGVDALVRQRLGIGMLLCALMVDVVVLVPAVFVQVGVPDYAIDGATHVDLVESLRHSVSLPGFGWYPVGFHAPAAALLALGPQIDSATGTVGWALAMTVLAPLAAFGFGVSVWHDLRAGAAGALLLALTSAFPYGAQLYSVWPMAAGMLLVVGLWITTLRYLAQPSARLAMLAGVLAGAMVLTHGTEVYTVGLGVAAFLVSQPRRVRAGQIVRHTGLALACALVVIVPYLPNLGNWVVAGGAVTVGTEYFDFRQSLDHANATEEAVFWASAISSGFLVDLPPRLALLVFGGWLAFRERRGRVLVPLTLLFAMFVALSRYVDAAPVRTVFALTLPWAVDDRLVMVVSVLAAPLAGFGLVRLADALARHAGRAAQDTVWRRAARDARLLVIAVGAMSVLFVAEKFSLQTGGIVTYSVDDARGMAWLRQHAQPDDVLMNDGAADAGIWAGYKANVTIVMPRTRPLVDPDSPELVVRANLGLIDTRDDVRQAACRLRFAYLFSGTKNSPSEYRQFPSLAELRRIQALEEVFNSGQTAVFRSRLNCARDNG